MEDITDHIAKMDLGHKMIAEGLKTAPAVFVHGLASTSGGVSCGRAGGEELWDLSMSFDAWRIDGEPLKKQKLSIRGWKVTDKEIAYWYNEIHPYSVVRIKARVVPDLPLGFSFGSLESYEGIVTNDAELNECARQLQQPVNYEDPILGIFSLDRSIGWFSAKTDWNGSKIDVNLNVNELARIPDAVKIAHSLWEAQSSWNQRIRNYAIHELLPLKNGEWIDNNEVKITAEK